MTTLVFTLLFFAFRYAGYVAEDVVVVWEASIHTDRAWGRRAFEKAYDAVYELQDSSGRQLEDFKGRPHPKTGEETLIPANFDASRIAIADIYAQGAVGHFQNSHPFLSKVIWAESGMAREWIIKDIKRELVAPGSVY